MVNLIFTHLLLCLLARGGVNVMASEIMPVKAAYWPNYAVNFPPSSIDTSFFSHIYYAFLMPNNVTFEFDLTEPTPFMLAVFSTTLHDKNPPVKTLVSIGGGSPTVFARMAASSITRASFINSSIEVARKFGFDGLDLDWENPKNLIEMDNLGYLFDEWRVAINNEAEVTHRSPLLLTAAVYFAVNFVWDVDTRKYPVASIAKNLDWVSPMCYDFHGPWDHPLVTGAHAALFDPNSNISTSYGLQSWVKAGVPPKKVVMGIPLYGRTWQLQDPNFNWVGAPAVGVGPGDEGTMPFFQVEEFNRLNGATVVHDDATVSDYSFTGTTWIGYDDAITAKTKVEYAQALGLGGYFFWSVNDDNDWKISQQASQAWIED